MMLDKRQTASLMAFLARIDGTLKMSYEGNGLRICIHDREGNLVRRDHLDAHALTVLPADHIENAFWPRALTEPLAEPPFNTWDSKETGVSPNLKGTPVELRWEKMTPETNGQSASDGEASRSGNGDGSLSADEMRALAEACTSAAKACSDAVGRIERALVPGDSGKQDDTLSATKNERAPIVSDSAKESETSLATEDGGHLSGVVAGADEGTTGDQ